MDLSVAKFFQPPSDSPGTVLAKLLREAHAKHIPQARETWISNDGGLCAMAAAFFVATARLPMYSRDIEQWAESFGRDLVSLVINWNDTEGLTFAQIAERLEAMERLQFRHVRVGFGSSALVLGSAGGGSEHGAACAALEVG